MYPALAAAEAMQAYKPGTAVYFVGTVGGFERPLLEKSAVTFAAHDEVLAGPLHGVHPLKAVASVIKLLRGTVQAFRLLGRHQPDVILSTGGWVGFPVSLAAKLRRVPLLIYLPDIEPGLTIKALRFLADQVAVTATDSQRFFRAGQTIVTGYPLRSEVLAVADRPDARGAANVHFGLSAARRTLLVFGGSLGARAINKGVIAILPDLLADGWQILHVTGKNDAQRAAEQVQSLGDIPGREHYHACAYLHDDMALAFAAADMVVCRAGASVLGEFPLFGLPSILIPLAYDWHYQQVNADYLAGRGAAIHLDETRMAEELLPTIRALMQDEARLHSMQAAARALGSAAGALNLARALEALARRSADLSEGKTSHG